MDREKIRETFLSMGDRIADLVDELNPKRRSGYFEIDCPECGEKGRAYLYLPNRNHPEPRIKCNRGSCGYSSSLLDYYAGEKGLSFWDALSELATAEGVDLEISPEAKASWERKQTEKEALEKVQDFFERTLWSPEGKETLDYLRTRGYSDEEITTMRLGSFPGAGKTLSFLGGELGLDTSPDALSWALKDGGSLRKDYKLTFPYRGPDGAISAFMGRLIRPLQEGEKAADKYKPLGEYAGVKASPFGLHALQGDTVILVEGQLDALSAGVKGFPNVVALGGNLFTEGQLEALRRKGIKNLILALDGDPAGREGTEAIVREALSQDLSVFVAEIEGAKDPDELIRTKGASSFQEILDRARADGRGIKWLLRRIAGKHDLTTDMGKTDAFREMEGIIKKLQHPMDITKAKEFMGEALEIEPWDLEPFLDHARNLQQREEEAREIRQSLSLAQGQVKEDPMKALSTLREQVERTDRRHRDALTGSLFPEFSMDHLMACLNRAGEGAPTGFKDLEWRGVRYPQGAITLVAGRPSHGKTATLINLLRRQMELNPGKRYVFASYEEDAHWIISKIFISMANTELGEDPSRMLSAYQRFIRGKYHFDAGDSRVKGKVLETWDRLRDALESGRLMVAYRPGDARELSQAILGLREKYGEELGAVFVDYMQIVPPPEDLNASSSYQKVQSISGIIRDTAVKSDLPIIVGAQLNRRAMEKAGSKVLTLDQVLRPEYLREAGDLEQDANLILGLFNKVAAQREEGNLDKIPDFSLTVLKNRNGPTGDTIELLYDRSRWRMNDAPKRGEERTPEEKKPDISPFMEKMGFSGD